MPPDWWFDEAAHAGPEHLQSGRVAGYDRKAGFDPVPEVERLLALGLGPEHTLVDAGAGTGTLAVAAAAHCKRVVAFDVSAEMVGHIRHRARQASAHNVEAVQAGFLTYAHAGPAADFVYSRHALHHLPDHWKVEALRRLAAMLRPGGVFVLRDLVYTFAPAEFGDRISAWVESAHAFPRSELSAHVRDEFSTYSWLLEAMLERTGFEFETAELAPGGLHALYICRRTA